MGKYCDTTCSHRCKQLGIPADTSKITTFIPDENGENLKGILLTTWHNHRKIFTLRECASLLGIVASLDLTTSWDKRPHILL